MKKVAIPIDHIALPAVIRIPVNASGLVIFSHGSGSGHQSPRNNFVASSLEQNGFATVLADLLTQEEDADYYLRFNIELLVERLIRVTHWAMKQPGLQGLPIGYFGASTGAAAALHAASLQQQVIKAIVSRGGRPDLAMAALPDVKAPVLLLVGSLDKQVIELNYKAYDFLKCQKEIAIVEGASHLFEEAGKLEEVARLAIVWFDSYLRLHLERNKESLENSPY